MAVRIGAPLRIFWRIRPDRSGLCGVSGADETPPRGGRARSAL